MFQDIESHAEYIVELSKAVSDFWRFPNIGTASLLGIKLKQASSHFKINKILNGLVQIDVSTSIHVFALREMISTESPRLKKLFSFKFEQLYQVTGSPVFIYRTVDTNADDFFLYMPQDMESSRAMSYVESALASEYNTLKLSFDRSERVKSPRLARQKFPSIPTETSESLLSDLLSAPRRSVLIYGQPGTGKSNIMYDIANRAEVLGKTVFIVNFGELNLDLSVIIGAIRIVSPDIVILDDIDVSDFKSNTQSFDTLRRYCHYVVATANKPDALYPPLLRPGRFDILYEHQMSSTKLAKTILQDLFDRDIAKLPIAYMNEFRHLCENGLEVQEAKRRMLAHYEKVTKIFDDTLLTEDFLDIDDGPPSSSIFEPI